MLACLRHHAVSSGYHDNSAIHLGGTSNHILDEVSVTRSINVSVVTLGCPVLAVVERNSNASSFLFRSFINCVNALNASSITCGLIHVENMKNSGC